MLWHLRRESLLNATDYTCVCFRDSASFSGVSEPEYLDEGGGICNQLSLLN